MSVKKSSQLYDCVYSQLYSYSYYSQLQLHILQQYRQLASYLISIKLHSYIHMCTYFNTSLCSQHVTKLHLFTLFHLSQLCSQYNYSQLAIVTSSVNYNQLTAMQLASQICSYMMFCKPHQQKKLSLATQQLQNNTKFCEFPFLLAFCSHFNFVILEIHLASYIYS